jgi:hypothetical protein
MPCIDGDIMETQSDSIDITSIKFAALGAFEVSFDPAGSVSAMTADGVIFLAYSHQRPRISKRTCRAMID